MTVRCPNGHDNAEGFAFCSSCGTPLALESGNSVASDRPTSGEPLDASPTSPSVRTAGSDLNSLGSGWPSPTPREYPEPSATQSYGMGAPTPNTAPTAGRGPSKRVLIVGAAAAIVLLIGVGIVAALTGGDDDGKGSSATANGQSIRGIAMLLDSDGSIDGSWDSCQGTGGYSDFGAGMRLSIKGQNDEIVGSGDVVNVTEANIADVARAELDGDSPIGLEATNQSDAESELRDMLESTEGMACMVYFEAKVERSDFYAVELGSRGDLSYSRDELATNGYVVGISLGDF